MLSGSPPFVIHVLLSWRCEDHLGCDPRCQSTFHLESVHGKQNKVFKDKVMFAFENELQKLKDESGEDFQVACSLIFP
jgi:hypothetical protein